MAKTTIKTFSTEGDQKRVGFFVHYDDKKSYAIDKMIDIVEGKTREQYISEAHALAKPEIDAWLEETNMEGSEIDSDGNII